MFCVNLIQWPLQALGIQRKEEGAEAVASTPQHQGEGSLEEEASLCQMQSTMGSSWEQPEVWDWLAAQLMKGVAKKAYLEDCFLWDERKRK